MKIERKWAMPNKNTFSIKPIREFILDSLDFGSGEIQAIPLSYDGFLIDPFVGKNPLLQLFPNRKTNDLNPKIKADSHIDALDFLKNISSASTDCVFFDPPYSNRQISECYKGVGLDTKGGELTRSSFYSNLKIEIARILKVGGKAFCFGWNSQGIGMSRGFRLDKVLLVAHGGSHNDTIITLETKVQSCLI